MNTITRKQTSTEASVDHSRNEEPATLVSVFAVGRRLRGGHVYG